MPTNPIYLESLKNFDAIMKFGKDLFSQFMIAIQQKAQSFIPEPISYPSVEYLGATIQDAAPFEKLFTGKTKVEGDAIRQEMVDWFAEQFNWFDSVRPSERKYPTTDSFSVAYDKWSNELKLWENLKARLLTVANESIKKLPAYVAPEGAEILGFTNADVSKIPALFAADKATWEAKTFQELEDAKKQADLDYAQWELNVKKPDSVYFSDPAQKSKAEKDYLSVKVESKKLLSRIKKEIDAVIVAKTPVLTFPPVEFNGVTPANYSSFESNLINLSISELQNQKNAIFADWTAWQINAPKKPQKSDYPNDSEWQKADDEYTQKFQEAEGLWNNIEKAIDDTIAKKSIKFPQIIFYGVKPSDLPSYKKDIEKGLAQGLATISDVQAEKVDAQNYIDSKIQEVNALCNDPAYTAPEIDKWLQFLTDLNKIFDDVIANYQQTQAQNASNAPSSVFKYTALNGVSYELSDLPAFQAYLSGLKTQKACKDESVNLSAYANAELAKLTAGTKEYSDFESSYSSFQSSILAEIVSKKLANAAKKSAKKNANAQTATQPQPATPTTSSYVFQPIGYQGGKYILEYKTFHKSTVSDFSKYLRTLPTENDVLAEKNDLDVFLNGSLQEWEKYNQNVLSKSDFDTYRKRLVSQINDFRDVFTDAIDKEIDRRQQMAPPPPKVVPPYDGTGKKQVAEFSPDVSYFPNDVSDTKDTNVRLGGSTGAKMVEDENGNRFILKKGNSPEHLKSECFADAFYQAAGVKVPAFKLYDVNGEPVKLSAELKNAKSLDDWWKRASKKERDDMRNKLRQGYAADVLLGNWDVVGMGADNILIDEKGEPWRIDNGGSLKFRAQGAVKTDDQWGKYIDDLFTMTGNGSIIGANTSTTITQYYGPTRFLDLAKEINERDWTKALATLPPDERKVVENRLEEVRQLAERGADAEHFGRTQESTDSMLAFSYQLSKDGLREALPQKVELNGSNLGDWKNLDGWFYDGNVTRTLNGKNYDSFSEYIADKMGEDGFNFIGKANGDQGSDSYYDDSVTRKLCVLKTQGLDCTDPKYKTFDDFAQDVQNAGYYCGLKNGTGYPKDHWDTFSNKFDAARKNLQQFNSYYQAVNQYDAAVQLILENVELKNVDPKTRTYVICRTESDGILQSSPGVVGLPNPGERTYHKTGVCESHVRVKAFAFRGHNTTVVRVPFSRVHGLWMIERGKVSLGKYHPEQHAQYLGANENETGADTHGLPIVYVGTDSPVSESHKALAQWERNNPNLVVTGIYSK